MEKVSKTKFMNFVYNSREIKHIITVGHIKYEWDGLDLRDYLSEDVIKQSKGIIIAKDGGILRAYRYDKVSSLRKYQVIDKFTEAKDIKSKFLLVCPKHMSWESSEVMSSGVYEKGEKYLEITDESLGDLDALDIASNLSYMYGVRFIPHKMDDSSLYRICAEENIDEMWRDIVDNVKEIKKFYKLEEIYVDSVRKSSKINDNKITEEDFLW